MLKKPSKKSVEISLRAAGMREIFSGLIKVAKQLFEVHDDVRAKGYREAAEFALDRSDALLKEFKYAPKPQKRHQS